MQRFRCSSSSSGGGGSSSSSSSLLVTGYLVGKSASLMIERLRIRTPSGAAGLPENFLLQSPLRALTLMRCPFHPSVTEVARERPRPFCQKCKWQVAPAHAYTLDPTKLEWADYAAVPGTVFYHIA